MFDKMYARIMYVTKIVHASTIMIEFKFKKLLIRIGVLTSQLFVSYLNLTRKILELDSKLIVFK